MLIYLLSYLIIAMKKYMGMRAALVDPLLLKSSLEFHIASSTYLTYLATGGDNSKPFHAVKFPLTDCKDRKSVV